MTPAALIAIVTALDVMTPFVTTRPLPSDIVVLVDSRELNAWSDGKNIAITTRMVEEARNGDELAFVIAHELGHNITGELGTKQAEIDADAMGIRLMRLAGYGPHGAVSFLEHTPSPWLAIDHPTNSRRIKLIREHL